MDGALSPLFDSSMTAIHIRFAPNTSSESSVPPPPTCVIPRFTLTSPETSCLLYPDECSVAIIS